MAITPLGIYGFPDVYYDNLVANAATVKYVSTSGNDSNNGNSISTAYLTIGQALSATSGNSGTVTIVILPGTYTLTPGVTANSVDVMFSDGNLPRVFVCSPNQTILQYTASVGNRDCQIVNFQNSGSAIYGATLKRNNNGRTENYMVAFFNGTFAAQRGKFYNCVFSETNAGNRWSIQYDNNGSQTPAVFNCTFYNGANSLSDYSGSSSWAITDSVFNTTVTTNVTLTRVTQSATVNATTYVATGISDRGVWSGTYSWGATISSATDGLTIYAANNAAIANNTSLTDYLFKVQISTSNSSISGNVGYTITGVTSDQISNASLTGNFVVANNFSSNVTFNPSISGNTNVAFSISSTINGNVFFGNIYLINKIVTEYTTSIYPSVLFSTGNSLLLANSAPLNLAGGNWTVECWVSPNGTYTSNNVFFSKRTNVTSSTTSYQGYLNLTTGNISFSNGSPTFVSSTTLSPNTWSHVAYTYNGSNVSIFVNGNSVYTTPVTIADTSGNFVIGAFQGNNSNNFYPESFLGYMRDLRVTKGVAIYTGNFSVPTKPLNVAQISGTNVASTVSANTSLLALQTSSVQLDFDEYQSTIFITNSAPVTSNYNPYTYNPSITGTYGFTFNGNSSIPYIVTLYDTSNANGNISYTISGVNSNAISNLSLTGNIQMYQGKGALTITPSLGIANISNASISILADGFYSNANLTVGTLTIDTSTQGMNNYLSNANVALYDLGNSNLGESLIFANYSSSDTRIPLDTTINGVVTNLGNANVALLPTYSATDGVPITSGGTTATPTQIWTMS